MTETAVVILNYNGRHFLQQFLPGVIANSGTAKIVVADNASTDDSVNFLTENFQGKIEIVQLESNKGYCGGYNAALKQVEATYYVLLNSDVEVTPGWIEPVIQILKQDANIAAAQPKIVSFHTRNEFEYAGAAGGFVDSFGYPFCRGRIFNTLEKDQNQYNDTCPIFWATGACLFIKSEVFHRHGGFDEDFFAHMEEIDLCWRIQLTGQSIYYTGHSKVYHVGGGTLAKSNPRKTYFNFRNGLSLLLKNLPAMQLVWKIPVRVVLDWLAALKFLLGGSGDDCLAVLKAHGSFFWHLKRDYFKRGSSSKKTIPTIYKGSVLFGYYLFGKKYFTDFRI
ncbi:MAG: glycosyltransferase family 2 protein [Cyclobacteriaceae bacterium]|nr:glycosyltransferase family 2 protein [Cyclobacteriaceae bacterium]